MENYFNYFTEIEEHFQRRRGTTLLLSTLDWALIESWKEAGIPLEAALRGIDATFERYQQRPLKTRKINSLAYCAQEVLAAAEEMKEAAVGVARKDERQEGGLDADRIAAYLVRNAEQIGKAELPPQAQALAQESARTLRQLAADLPTGSPAASGPGLKFSLEELERRLTVMEEKLLAVLLAVTSDDDIVAVRARADREIAPYRRKMSSAQIEQLHRQYVHKSLLERHRLPRLSLFYM